MPMVRVSNGGTLPAVGYIYGYTGGVSSIQRAFETLPYQSNYCTLFAITNKEYKTITGAGGLRICGVYEDGTVDNKMGSMYATLDISNYTYVVAYAAQNCTPVSITK